MYMYVLDIEIELMTGQQAPKFTGCATSEHVAQHRNVHACTEMMTSSRSRMCIVAGAHT